MVGHSLGFCWVRLVLMGLRRRRQLRRLLFLGAMSRWRKRVAKGAKLKKSAKGAELKNRLSVGDLVVAKVKGFPPWPAKIGRPEDWGRAPDPERYFVEFFGTGEIGFIRPADVLAFTNEVKNKLLAKCAGKTVRLLANAVKEICEAFDELQQNNSNEADRSVLGPGGPSADGVEADAMEAEMKDASGRDESNQETEATGLIDHDAGLEHCSPSPDVVDCQQVKPEASSSFPQIK